MNSEVSLKVIRQHSNSQISPLRVKKSPKNSNQVFLSKQQRFPRIKIHNDQIPGPGSYIDPLARSRKLQKQKDSTTKNFSENHLDGFVSRQHQWIFGSDRLHFNNNGSSLGPGAYEIAVKNMQKSLSPHSWGTSDRFNGSEWSYTQTSLGPGTYNVEKNNSSPKKKEMGIFKSKSPKTFLEQLQKNIQKNMERPVQGSNHFEPLNNEEAEEQLQNIANSHDKQSKPKKMDPVFLSRSKRYELINPQNSQTGPGAYELRQSEFIKQKLKTVKSVIVSNNYVRKRQQTKGEKPTPGPTSYQVQKFNMQRELEKKISSLKGNMSLETRWKKDWKKASETIPGPGSYNRQRYVFINEKQYEHKPLVNHHEKVDVPFLSSSSRIVEDKVLNPFGSYNVNQFDMSEKMRKKRSHIEKLKAMDISVPGFESSQRRTTFNLGKLIKGLGKFEGTPMQGSKVKIQQKI